MRRSGERLGFSPESWKIALCSSVVERVWQTPVWRDCGRLSEGGSSWRSAMLSVRGVDRAELGSKCRRAGCANGSVLGDVKTVIMAAGLREGTTGDWEG